MRWLCFLLGTIPGPVLTGSVIDSACALWQDICGSRGACWVYNRFEMSWRLFAWWIAVKIFSALTFYLSSKLHKSPRQDSNSSTLNDDDTDDVNDMNNKDTITSESVIHGLTHMWFFIVYWYFIIQIILQKVMEDKIPVVNQYFICWGTNVQKCQSGK